MRFIVLQVAAIKQLKKENPDERFWIKLDGTDVRAGIMESKRRVWNGDADHDDGKLKELRKEYLDMNAKMDLLKTETVPQSKVEQILESTISVMRVETEFLNSGFEAAQKHFEEKMSKGNCPEATLKESSWEVVEYQTLLQQSQQFATDFQHALSTIASSTINQVMKVKIDDLASKRSQYLRNLYKKKRTGATHVVVTMLSDEKRANKPYALHVRYIPCTTLKDNEVRMFNQELKREMKKENMTLAGINLVLLVNAMSIVPFGRLF